jgi:tetratricopeptide (TPR) repeat protein
MRKRNWILAVLLLTAVVVVGCKHPFVNSGNIYVDQGLLKKAEYCYRYAINEEPDNGEAHFQLGYTLSEMAKEHLAEGELDSARVKFIEASEHYMRAAEIDSAMWKDDADLNMSSNFARVFNEGSKLVRQGEEDAALEFYEMAYHIDPRGENGARARLNIVQIRFSDIQDQFTYARGQDDAAGMQEARDEAQQLLATIDETMPTVRDQEDKRTFIEVKAAALRMLDRDDEARALYEELLEENPDDINLMLALARSQKEQREYAGAARFYQRALDQIAMAPIINQDGRYDYVYAECARAYFRADMFEEAVPAFRQALDVAKSDAERIEYYDRIAVCYYNMEDYENALDYARRVTDMDPEHLNGWQIQCRSLNRLERQEEAEPACLRFSELRTAQEE